MCPVKTVRIREALGDISSLAFLQGMSFVFSFATLPYLLRIYSITDWGHIVFVQLVVNYAIWFTNWGYHLGATRDVATCRDVPEALTKKFSAVWLSQFYLLGLAFILLLVACNAISELEKSKNLYYASFGMILGNVLMPVWLLNGVGLIKAAAIFQLIPKLFAFVLTFLFIHQDASASMYFYVSSISALVSSGLMLAWMRQERLLILEYQSFCSVCFELKANAQIFYSSALSTVNNTIFPMLIGINCGPHDLALFNIVDRVKGVGTAIINPIAHAIYPRICYALGRDSRDGIKLAYRFVSYMVGIATVMCIGMLIFAEPIVHLLGGAQYSSANLLLMIVSISPVLNTASANIANQILIANGYSREYFRSLLIVTIFLVPALFVVSSYFGLVSSVVLLVFAEFLFLILIANVVCRLKLYR